MNLTTAAATARDLTDTLNALGIRGTFDNDVVATEAHYFWEVPVKEGVVVFATLWLIDGEAGFGVDVRDGINGEPVPAYGEYAAPTLTGQVIAASLVRAVTLAEIGCPIV